MGVGVIYKGHSHSNYIFCKFNQTLGGVMKYILITLLSFTFATQITTREFEIEIPIGSNGYQFYANIDLLDYIGIDYAQITPIEISDFNISQSYAF